MSWKEDLWAWVKAAPLPVVLALTAASAGISIMHDRTQVVAKAEAAAKEAGEAKSLALAMEKKDEIQQTQLERMEEKVDRLLELVGELKARAKPQR